MFFAPEIFWGVPLPAKKLDLHHKIGPSSDHRAKFHAGRPTHLGDLTLKKTSAQGKTQVLPKTIASGRTNNCILVY